MWCAVGSIAGSCEGMAMAKWSKRWDLTRLLLGESVYFGDDTLQIKRYNNGLALHMVNPSPHNERNHCSVIDEALIKRIARADNPLAMFYRHAE